jgi:signal transduction histidine kinase
VVVLLVATLGATAMLAYEAQQAARSHRATTESVLREYAGFAAWELARLGRTHLLSVVTHELSHLQRADWRGALPVHAAGSGECGTCGGTRRILSAFRADLRGGDSVVGGEPLDGRVLGLLQEAAANVLRSPSEFSCPALRAVTVNGTHLVVVWRHTFGEGNTPTGTIGFVSDDSFVASVFKELLDKTPLLPPSLVGGKANPNSVLTIRVSSSDGAPLFASAGDWSPYAAEQALQPDLGSLKLAVALKPDAAGGLVIGGLPRERLPLVVGLLALTAGLVVVAVVQLRREAELSRLRADFVSGVSHELRTPLAQIRMFTETLLLGRVRSETEGRRSLEIIARETQRLTQLVENVLVFSRGERRIPRILREAARLAPIVTEVVESFAPLAAAREARIVTELNGGISANVDAGAVRQVLLNLLDNAVKYGPPGQTVSVTLRLEADRARLTVEDEGPGIDATSARRVWEPFHRLPAAAQAQGGAGIGLAIVRQLIDLHDGRAWVERGLVGARFVIEIPGAWSEPRASTAVA